jgi:hypothetical protein
MVSNFEDEWLASLVRITLLSGFGSLNIGLMAIDCLFSLGDEYRIKDFPLTRLNSVKWHLTVTSIECFQGCHLDAFLVTFVIGELSQCQTLVPALMIVHQACSEHIFKDLIHPFH